jgi:hypothetical protein
VIQDAENHEGFEKLRSAKAKRETQRRKPSVVTWEPDGDDLEEYPFRPLEGSVTLFWSVSGMGLVDDLETAIATNDLERMDEVGAQLLEHEAVRAGEQPSLDEAIEKAIAAPVLFDFSYGSRELGENLFLSDVPLGSLTLPYTGGELDLAEFDILEHPCVWPDECPPPWPDGPPWPDPDDPPWPDGPLPPKGPYEYLVVVTPPDMSDIERKAVETIPPDVHEANILPMSPVAGAVAAAVVAVSMAAAVVAATTASPGVHEELRGTTIPDRMINELGARPAAGELLDMRREVMREHGFM